MIGDIRQMYHLQGSDSGDYIPSLYIKSDVRFRAASDEIEDAVLDFRDAITSEQLLRSHKKKPSRNLTHRQLELVRFSKTMTSTLSCKVIRILVRASLIEKSTSSEAARSILEMSKTTVYCRKLLPIICKQAFYIDLIHGSENIVRDSQKSLLLIMYASVKQNTLSSSAQGAVILATLPVSE
jgi:hypothetical protein